MNKLKSRHPDHDLNLRILNETALCNTVAEYDLVFPNQDRLDGEIQEANLKHRCKGHIDGSITIKEFFGQIERLPDRACGVR